MTVFMRPALRAPHLTAVINFISEHADKARRSRVGADQVGART